MTEQPWQAPRKPAPWEAAATAWSEEHVRHCCCEGAGWVRGDFPLGHVLFGKAVPCVCQRDQSKRERAERLRQKSGLGLAAREMTFQSFDATLVQVGKGQEKAATIRQVEGIKHACQQFGAHPHGWLVLCGAYGSGKTHLATAIANMALGMNRACYMATVPEMLDVIRAGMNDHTADEWMRMVQEVELLILDDLGQGNITDWGREVLFKVLVFRHRNNLATVVTTNLNIDGIRELLGGAIASRLSDGAQVQDGFSRILVLPVGDFRPGRRAR